jgi:hypothetical protein
VGSRVGAGSGDWVGNVGAGEEKKVAVVAGVETGDKVSAGGVPVGWLVRVSSGDFSAGVQPERKKRIRMRVNLKK